MNEIAPQGLGQDWLDKLAQAAKEQAATEKPTGNFFSTKGGTLSWNNMALPGNKMEVIVLASAHENIYYGAAFDAVNPASPLCYAYSLSGLGMTPHSEVEQQQSPTCASCRQAKWGSGDRGKGTACKPIRRLALLPASAAASIDAVEKATVGLLRVPITSVANWVAYVGALANRQLPTFAVVCEIAVIPDAKTMFKIAFTPKQPIEDTTVLNALMLRKPMEEVAMQAPYMRRTPQQVQQPQPQAAPAPAVAFGGAAPAATKF